MSKRSRHPSPINKPVEFFDVIDKLAPRNKIDIRHTPSGQTNRIDNLVKIRRMPVAWGFALDEVIFSKWFVNFLDLKIMPWDNVITAQSTYLPDARNIIHKGFFETECEYLVMLDSDVLPPPDFLSRLLTHHLPMVGGWYHKKGDPYPPCVYDVERTDEQGITWYKVREQPGTGLEKVDAAGAGCWLMRRDVALAIGEKPYNMEHGGEDMELCRKVKAAGFDIYIDWSVASAHCGVAIV